MGGGRGEGRGEREEGICHPPMLYLASPWLDTIDSSLLYNPNNKQQRGGRGGGSVVEGMITVNLSLFHQSCNKGRGKGTKRVPFPYGLQSP